MTHLTLASFTAASNGARWNLRSASSSTSALQNMRFFSWSLAAKCFTHAATPSTACTPRMYETAICVVCQGSSPKHSKVRPAMGFRIMFTVGPRRTLAPLTLVSSPRSTPRSATSAGSQVAPMATPQGTSSAVGPWNKGPRAPNGPSVKRMGGMPALGTPWLFQKSLPLSRPTSSLAGSSWATPSASCSAHASACASSSSLLRGSRA
mmetsp:Transcript_88115/g.227236  ORF Transcript_88115/g.227236 Transcript_88115/m.227236 type:complete len:207 (+) Transcript_88115:1338-1958(+)